MYFQRCFDLFKNFSFKKENVETSKTEIIYEYLRNIWVFRFGTVALILHCYSGDKKQNKDFFQVTCFKESKNMTAEKNVRGAINFL